MKILYLHQYFNTPEMSGGTRSYEMARRLVRAGHHVDLITTDRSPKNHRKSWRVEIIEGINVHWWPLAYSNSMSFFSRIMVFLSFASAARKRAIECGGDVVLASSTPLTIALPGVAASRKIGVPLIFEVRDLWPEMPIAVGALRNPVAIAAARRLESYAYNNSAWIIALSPGMAMGIERAGFDAKRISVIPNSSDIEMFSKIDPITTIPGAPGVTVIGKPLILYAGTLGKINGVCYFADIARAATDTGFDANFLVVGDGKEKAKIQEHASGLGVLDRNFWMVPPVPKNEIPAYLAAATVSCSFCIDIKETWNNSANKFFDTLAAGRPILVNYGGWQAELIRDREIGLVIPPADARVAAKQIAEYVSNDLEPYRINASNVARTEFSRDKLAEDLLCVIEAVARSPSQLNPERR